MTHPMDDLTLPEPVFHGTARGGFLPEDAFTADQMREVIAAEREACAQIADRYHVPMCDTFAEAIAQDIRARGQT